MSENFFYLNRNQPKHVLYFKEWLPNVYLPGVKILRRNNISVAESRYRQELQDAITACSETHPNSKQKLTSILSHFNSMPKVRIIKKNIEFLSKMMTQREKVVDVTT